MKKRGGVLTEKSFEYALKSVTLYKNLVNYKREYILSRQFLRSSTAIGALIREAQNAESRKDFIHKLAMSQKEADETLYWIELLFAAEYIDAEQYKEYSNGVTEIFRLLQRIIISTKANSV